MRHPEETFNYMKLAFLFLSRATFGTALVLTVLPGCGGWFTGVVTFFSIPPPPGSVFYDLPDFAGRLQYPKSIVCWPPGLSGLRGIAISICQRPLLWRGMV